MTATLSLLALLAFIVGVVLGVAWMAQRRGSRLSRLERAGRPTTGRLCAKNARTQKGQTIYSLIYEYSADQGTYQRSIVVSRNEYEAAEDGTSIELVYLPADPRVAATRERVGQAISAARARRPNARRRWDD